LSQLAHPLHDSSVVKVSHPRPDRAGFSLLEAVVAAGVLGIALAALTNAHLTSIRGVDNSNDAIVARSVARALADDIAILQFRQPALFVLGGCSDAFGGLANTIGCQAPGGSAYTAPFAPCTRYFTEEAVMVPGPASQSGNLFLSGNLADVGQPYRADIFVDTHPDASIDPGESRVLNVFVCWRDPLSPGRVRQVRETRVLNRTL
jgi:type II secretory pathway pseudopilin PulG